MAERLRQVRLPDGFVYLRLSAIESVSEPFDYTSVRGEACRVRTVMMASATSHIVLDTPQNGALFMEES